MLYYRCEKKGTVIRTCRLLEVVPYEKESETVLKYRKMKVKFDCVRTTFKGPNMGVFF